MRLFVAIEAPAEWRRALAEARRALPEPVARSLRFAEPHLAHVTLRFIGEVADEHAPEVLRNALDRAVTPFAIPLHLGRAGTFGAPARTNVAWLGVEGDLEALCALAGRVSEAVDATLGIEGDGRPLSPHLTLARVRPQATPEERRAVAVAVAALPAPEPYPFIARQAVVVRSHLGPAGPRYEVLSHHGHIGGGPE
ncbi:MAG: RNA 2',3'-cyclic phosphodiesterase [Chloroflexi bacterium HGW-Chloroflexi-9]|nr:MAG: RNA 2',3'-cyclic phosphodiesterase [Chloroflexi bacterium HGW-Chloroflexi-9]